MCVLCVCAVWVRVCVYPVGKCVCCVCVGKCVYVCDEVGVLFCHCKPPRLYQDGVP